jgi:demethylmenaquinone methyltransferase/2-methoxy-6-polyprenyl-1,4-benzoquinol methylase
MLAIAQGRLAKVSASGISFRVGDATAMDLPDAWFDGTVTAFCVRNLTDRRRAWAEIFRTLAPGGRLAVLELTRPHNRILRVIHRSYTRWFVPAVARVLTDSRAYRYLSDSVEQFASPECIADELSSAGFAAPDCRPLSGGTVTLFVTHRPQESAATPGSVS